MVTALIPLDPVLTPRTLLGLYFVLQIVKCLIVRHSVVIVYLLGFILETGLIYVPICAAIKTVDLAANFALELVSNLDERVAAIRRWAPA